MVQSKPLLHISDVCAFPCGFLGTEGLNPGGSMEPLESFTISVLHLRTETLFLGSRITVDGDYSHEIKRCLFLGRKAMRNLEQSIKKQRHHFANKGLYRAMVSPVVMYGCESWTIKKAERQRIDAFKLWC